MGGAIICTWAALVSVIALVYLLFGARALALSFRLHRSARKTQLFAFNLPTNQTSCFQLSTLSLRQMQAVQATSRIRTPNSSNALNNCHQYDSLNLNVRSDLQTNPPNSTVHCLIHYYCFPFQMCIHQV